MKRQVTLPLALVIGIGVGTLAVQGLHAQTKPKAFTIADVEILDKAALEPFAKAAVSRLQEAGGRSLDVTGGKIVSRQGEPPKAVILIEWDNLDKAEAYFKSPTFAKFTPERDKVYKTTRAYLVEAGPNFKGFTLQGSKPKAYVINEIEVFDRAALGNAPPDSSLRDAGGQPTGVAVGKIVQRTGEPPKGVALWGFNNLEQAEAYLKSPAWANRLSQLEKGLKVTRSYIVEATQ